jgi:putative transposase
MYPSRKQQDAIRRHIGACRFVYNWALEKKIQLYSEEKKSISWYELNNMLPDLKGEHVWLKDVNAQSLQQAVRRVDLAFKHFFRRLKLGGKAGFPKFKSKRRPIQSFDIPQSFKVEFSSKHVRLPRIGRVKTNFHRKFNGVPKRAVVSETATKKFFISIVLDDCIVPPEKSPFSNETTIGFDLGIMHFGTTSNTEKIPNPKYLEKSILRLKVLQKRLSRKSKNSKNREKARIRVAKTHEKIRNQRMDYLHKISKRLVHENQGIVVERLNVSGMVQNRYLARAINDVGWSTFITLLQYKCEWYGKTLIRIGRFEPTSKLCSRCGWRNEGLTLSDRTWICQECHIEHDRDINAAINIKKLGLSNYSPWEPGVEPVNQSASADGMKQEITESTQW